MFHLQSLDFFEVESNYVSQNGLEPQDAMCALPCVAYYNIIENDFNLILYLKKLWQTSKGKKKRNKERLNIKDEKNHAGDEREL